MTRSEIVETLGRVKVGRLGCANQNQPYVVPINFAFDGRYLYAFTTLGKKVEWMRANPKVCFEVDEIKNHNHWTSIVVFGRYEELPDKPEYEEARKRAYSFLQKRAMWWEPAFVSENCREQPHSLTPIFFRVRIEEMSGHRASSDERRPGVTLPDDTQVITRDSHRETKQPSLWARIRRAVLHV